MKPRLISLNILFIYLFAIVMIGCNDKTDQANLTKLIEIAKQCSEQKFAFLAECQKKESQSMARLQSCLSSCQKIPFICTATGNTGYNNCISNYFAQVGSCQQTCYREYYETAQEIEKCKNNWDVEFWKCMESKSK